MSVVGGDYKGNPIVIQKGQPFISIGYFGKKRVYLNKDTIERYEVIGADTSKNLGSSLVKGAVGGAILGPAGMVAGALAGSNNTNATLAIYFKDGKKSIIKVNEQVYHSIISDFL
jgi:hypothetical protein